MGIDKVKQMCYTKEMNVKGMGIKGVAYGVLLWAWYQVCVTIGTHVNPSAAHMVRDILG